MFWIVTELHTCIYNRVSTHVLILQTFINTHIVYNLPCYELVWCEDIY